MKFVEAQKILGLRGVLGKDYGVGLLVQRLREKWEEVLKKKKSVDREMEELAKAQWFILIDVEFKEKTKLERENKNLLIGDLLTCKNCKYWAGLTYKGASRAICQNPKAREYDTLTGKKQWCFEWVHRDKENG